MNILIVGFGSWGKTINNILSNNKYYNISILSNQKIIKKNFFNYKSILELDLNFFDIIYIANSNEKHISSFRNLCKFNSKIIIEKPLTTNNEDLKLFNKIRNNNTFVIYKFIYSEFFKIIKNISNRESIDYIKFTWNKLGKHNKHGVHWDLSIHFISFFFALFPNSKTKKIEIIRSRKSKRYYLEEIEFIVKFDNLTLHIVNSWNHNIEDKNIKIQTNKNNYSLNLLKNLLIKNSLLTNRSSSTNIKENGFFIEKFINKINSSKSPISSIDNWNLTKISHKLISKIDLLLK